MLNVYSLLLFIFVYGLQDQCQKFFAHSLCVVVKYYFTAIFKTTTTKTGLTIFQELLPIFFFLCLPIHFISFYFIFLFFLFPKHISTCPWNMMSYKYIIKSDCRKYTKYIWEEIGKETEIYWMRKVSSF